MMFGSFWNRKDIHSQISQDFYKQLADEKWQERMKGLELLFKLLNDCKRIADDPAHKQLIASLGKVLARIQILIVLLYLPMFMFNCSRTSLWVFSLLCRIGPICFDKFKEKKTT
uniref:Uncharacterized protein n=1 Tax=Meloidogyne enterolobii TaxID=390850 RepID=A0A6V7Y7B8_MELEN|nr:unnamed protein product [Meloidogyne enterolobii]